jgi:hypothetical protein
MKRSRWQLASAICGLAAALQSGVAAEATSETFVGSAALIAGNGGTGTRMTTFSMRSLRPTAYGGTVTALETSALIDSRATWTNNQYNGQNGSFFVEFESGVVADISNTDGTTKRLSVPGTLPGTIAIGSKYRIRRHWTIADLFGPNNEAGVLGGRNSTEADNVLLWSPQLQMAPKYYYRNITGFSGWYSGPTLAGNTVVYPEQGIMVDRKTNIAQTIYWAGASRPRPMVAPVFPGYNLVGTLHSTAPVRLADLNLITGDATTGLAPGLNSTEADTLHFLNGDGPPTVCYYRNHPSSTGWRSGATAADDLLVQPGTAFYINRKAPRALFYWMMPSE